ncbi:hypothetical protein [Ferruginibacter sp.]
MKARLKYFFARLIVVLVAVHTLDVSIDLDHLTFSTANNRVAEAYDDIDSFSELILENIFHDNNLTNEGDHDDHGPLDKQFSKHQVWYTASRQVTVLPKVITPSTITPVHSITNSGFLPEAHTYSDYTPPEYIAC